MRRQQAASGKQDAGGLWLITLPGLTVSIVAELCWGEHLPLHPQAPAAACLSSVTCSKNLLQVPPTTLRVERFLCEAIAALLLQSSQAPPAVGQFKLRFWWSGGPGSPLSTGPGTPQLKVGRPALLCWAFKSMQRRTRGRWKPCCAPLRLDAVPGLLALRAWPSPEQAFAAAQGSASQACIKEHNPGTRWHTYSTAMPPQWIKIAWCSLRCACCSPA